MPVTPWVISGNGPDALRAQAERLAAHVAGDLSLEVADVGLALARRPLFANRAVILGVDRHELLAGVGALARGESAANVVNGVATSGEDVVFLFPGQGSQWAGMALELLDGSPVFAEHVRACGEALAPFVEWSLLDVLAGVEGAPSLDRVDVVQPVLFAVMVSLAELWRACGVHPAAMVGHSQGEIAAAHVAGALSLQDAARVVALRSRALQRLAQRGGMVSVSLVQDELSQLLDRWGERICIAAMNGPRSFVVSGDTQALDELLRLCEAQDIRARKIDVTYAAHSPQVDAVREELLRGLSGITSSSSEIPFFSTVTGEPLDTSRLDGDYWYRNLREPVRLEQVVRGLLADGARSFLELSPHPILTGGLQETIDECVAEPTSVRVTGSMRRGEGGVDRFLKSLAEAFVYGADVSWTEVFAATSARAVVLPTYAFQRERYWLDARVGAGGSLEEAGLRSSDHALLGASLTIAEDRKWLFTGRLSLQTHPWLSDHAVMGVVLLPGAALLEFALHAGAQLDCRHIHELVLEMPLLLSEQAATEVQIAVGEADETGARVVSIHSRELGSALSEEGWSEESWTRNATGVLGPTGRGQAGREAHDAQDGDPASGPWPPPGAIALDVDHVYRHLHEQGFDYGPAFQGLQAAWQLGDEVIAEVSLPTELRERASSFMLHPALLDAALHAGIGMFGVDIGIDGARPTAGAGDAFLPFSWTDVHLDRLASPSSLRVRLSPAGEDSISLLLTDKHGAHVASVRSLMLRRVSAEQLDQGGRDDQGSLFSLAWAPLSSAGQLAADAVVLLGDEARPDSQGNTLGIELHRDLRSLVAAIDAGLKPPAVVLLDWAAERDEGTPPEAAHAGVKRLLALAQEWLADEQHAGARLVLMTRGAVRAASGDSTPDLVAAAAWGLIRSALAEHPGRFGLIDLPAEQPSSEQLMGALAIDEPQLALRDGELLAPRLVRLPREQEDRAAETGDRAAESGDRAAESGLNTGTVLITGGTGKLGGFVARHLVVRHGVPSLVLASRSGRDARGAAELEQELRELGAEVAVHSCDVVDRDQLASLIDGLPPERPLRGVIHAAGLIDDGVIESLTPERVDRVLEPKVDAAWHLHELTRELDLSMFVLFSSAAGVFGTAGQGNYAAANAFMDALAAERQAQGLAATSIAWGLWAQESGLTSGLGEAGVARFARSGVGAMSTEQGLGLFDAARDQAQAQTIALRVDSAALRAHAREQTLPALLRGLVRMPATRTRNAQDRPLVKRLREASATERAKLSLEAVSLEVASVLGHAASQRIDPERSFKELGFDSLTAVELRNRLAEQTGLRLPATLVFDYPTPTSLAAHLLSEIDETRSHFANARTVPLNVEEPIAIVGMSCRYPGGVSSPEELWTLLASGKDAIAGFPDNRGWDLAGLYDPDPDHPGTSYAREGGFLYEASDFDSAFFGIGPSEALAMDPQQRLMLEASWEALEGAWIDPTSLRGTRTGVFVGVMHHADYAVGSRPPAGVERYLVVGNAGSVISGRVSYTLGLEGPAVSLDTACSSSLVALHLACQALRSGECSLALAGGVTVMSTPTVFVEFAQQRGLAPDGRCKSFAAAADGAGFSEGVGVLVLERLSDATRLGHPVAAVVSGSAVNQDGRSNGLTAPNGPSQQRVVREALANAGLSPRQVDAVEAHGTGTTLGDPIEAQGLLATYGQDRGEDRAPLWLGSIKSNIGHTQAAAGVAGVIKMVLALRHGMLPRTLHVDKPSPQVDWSTGAVSVLSEQMPWRRNGEPRRAGVSSFGISGTNAHVIVEEAPSFDDAGRKTGEGVFVGERGDGQGLIAWPLSGGGQGALRNQAMRLSEYLEGDAELDVCDIGFSLGCRPTFGHRAVLLGRSREQLFSGLGSLARGERIAGLVEGAYRDQAARAVWMFPGQGSQWPGMAADLLECSPVFRQSIEECQDALAPLVDWSLEEVLQRAPGAAALERVDVVQPALFAVMVSLAALWRACGVHPDAVAGHSQGEIAAAYVAGGLSLEDAARIVSLRSRALTALAGHGGMVSVVAGVGEVIGLLERCADSLAIAAVNGPSSVVVSGGTNALQELLEICHEQDVRARRITVDYAAHSESVEAIRGELLEGCTPVCPRSGEVPFYSTVSGGLLDTAELDGEYWFRNLRETVQLEQVTRALLDQGHDMFVEISPHPVLTIGVQETVDDVLHTSERVKIVGSLRREENGRDRFLSSLAEAWVNGAEVDWRAVSGARGVQRVDLPTYAFQRERYWLQRSGQTLGDVSASDSADLSIDDGDSLFGLDWTSISSERDTLSEPSESNVCALLARDDSPLCEGLRGIGMTVATYRDLPALGEALKAGAPIAGTVLLDADVPARGDVVDSAHALLYEVLDVVQGWLSDESFATSRLVLVSRNALAVGPKDQLDGLASAAVWGLVRSAQSEDPGRLTIVDVDGKGSSWEALTSAVAMATSLREPQLAVRDGEVLVPRLAVRDGEVLVPRLAVRDGEVLVPRLAGVSSGGERAPAAGAEQWPDRGRSVLITGGTSGLGALVARHLAAEHGTQSFVLASRRGPDAPEALELQGELENLGAHVTVVACDVGDRGQVEALIASVPPEHPLGAVIHAAGVLDDGVIQSLTAQRLDRVLAPKLDAAWHLHELTEQLDLCAFVLFSSAAGTLGSPGQGNYAAANAFLDALAAHRRARALTATSLAWGLWGELTQLTGELSESDRARMARSGVKALSSREGLSLFDQARALDTPLLLPMRLDVSQLRKQAEAASLPALLRGLVRVSDHTREGASFVRQLAGLVEPERGAVALKVVQSEMAIVLGSGLAETIDPERPFTDHGFTSLSGMELRNRLNAVTGFRLPSTVVFDYPTPAVLVAHLLEQVSPVAEEGDGEEEIRRMIAEIPLSRLREAGLIDALLKLAGSDQGDISRSDNGENVIQMIESMDIDDLVQRALQGPVAE